MEKLNKLLQITKIKNDFIEDLNKLRKHKKSGLNFIKFSELDNWDQSYTGIDYLIDKIEWIINHNGSPSSVPLFIKRITENRKKTFGTSVKCHFVSDMKPITLSNKELSILNDWIKTT